jgi:hypothetical protein
VNPKVGALVVYKLVLAQKFRLLCPVNIMNCVVHLFGGRFGPPEVVAKLVISIQQCCKFAVLDIMGLILRVERDVCSFFFSNLWLGLLTSIQFQFKTKLTPIYAICLFCLVLFGCHFLPNHIASCCVLGIFGK